MSLLAKFCRSHLAFIFNLEKHELRRINDQMVMELTYLNANFSEVDGRICTSCRFWVNDSPEKITKELRAGLDAMKRS